MSHRLNIKVDGLETILMLQEARRKALLEDSYKKDNVPVSPDAKFLVALFGFDAVVVVFLIASRMLGWW